jgi:hypothetical protein
VKTKYKYSPIKKGKVPTTDAERRANCAKLADIMEGLRPGQHKQDAFAVHMPGPDNPNACGTAGCALGWACMSDQFPGLQYMAEPRFKPVVNGKREELSNTAVSYFGANAWLAVFVHGDLSTREVIRRLRAIARDEPI